MSSPDENDDEKPLTFWRALRTPEYWLVLTGAGCAMGGLSSWIVVPSIMAGLTLVSMPRYIELWPLAQATGAERMWWQTVALSMLNNFAAAVACVLLGRFLWWVWW